MAAPHDIAHLVSLLAAAKAEAETFGAAGAAIASALDEALRAAHALAAEGGRADEGIPPEELTTGNDK